MWPKVVGGKMQPVDHMCSLGHTQNMENSWIPDVTQASGTICLNKAMPQRFWASDGSGPWKMRCTLFPTSAPHTQSLAFNSVLKFWPAFNWVLGNSQEIFAHTFLFAAVFSNLPVSFLPYLYSDPLLSSLVPPPHHPPPTPQRENLHPGLVG